MIFLEFTAYVFVAGLILFLTSQILVPGYKGTPLFPMFRRKTQAREYRLAELREEVELLNLDQQIEEAEARVHELRTKRQKEE